MEYHRFQIPMLGLDMIVHPAGEPVPCTGALAGKYASQLADDHPDVAPGARAPAPIPEPERKPGRR